MTPERVAFITIVHGRHDHLERQLWGLASQSCRPDLVVVVAMDDAGVEPLVRRCVEAPTAPPVAVPTINRVDGRLPLAAARNLGVDTATSAGATQLILLDVDCIPSSRVVERYCTVMDAVGDRRAHVLSGEVTYLPPAPDGQDYRDLDLEALASPHSARPILAPDEIRLADDLRLFWSLSFATTADTWRTLGGFDESYTGYGGEDTDFAQRLGAANGGLTWVGGARAFHQHHLTSDPPTEHVHDVVANANRFAARWGWWPMEGWLEAFARLGLARRLPDGRWAVTDAESRRL